MLPLPKRRLAGACVAFLAATSWTTGCGQAQESTALPQQELTTAQDTILYALGQGLAGQFNMHELFTAEELRIINQGLNDGVLGTGGDFELEAHLESMNQFISERRQVRGARLKEEGDIFVAEQAALPGAQQTESGLVYFEVEPGTGASPEPTDEVVVHYEGRFSDGTIFDSSIRRGEPATFPLNRVIPGWTEGLQLMQAGGKAKLVIPSDLAYGDQGQPPAIPPSVPLVFEVELVEVKGK